MTSPRRTDGRFRSLAIPLGIALLTTACGTRTVTEKVYEHNRIQISLRTEKQGGEPVDRGFNQPAVISVARLVHILASIDLRSEEKGNIQRYPAIPSEILYPLAEGLAQVLGQASPADEIAVVAIRKEKRLGIFDRLYLTSFVTYVRGEQLDIHLNRSDWEIPKEGKKRRIPEPEVGAHPMKFSIIATRGMALLGRQSVAVDWRSPVFAKASRARVSASGKVERRTILMESPPEAVARDIPAQPIPANLSATALRRLADLEEQRVAGQVTEAEYNRRRREILGSHGTPSNNP
ncbi:hypothetical protein MK489_17930 [Myxococcota bacterium]|nr:hypothetical protein [Myxococcota bacterium]